MRAKIGKAFRADRKSSYHIHLKKQILHSILLYYLSKWPSTDTESKSIKTQKKKKPTNEANIKPSWPNKLGK